MSDYYDDDELDIRVRRGRASPGIPVVVRPISPHIRSKIGFFIRADKSSILNTAIVQPRDLTMKPRVLISSLLSTVVVQDPDPLVQGAKLLLHQ
jgi:hypothetical protein